VKLLGNADEIVVSEATPANRARGPQASASIVGQRLRVSITVSAAANHLKPPHDRSVAKSIKWY
jgi:hypothetical protein